MQLEPCHATGGKRKPSARSWLPARYGLGVKQLNCLFVHLHILAKGNRRGLGTGHQMLPAPGLTRVMEFFDHRLMMFKGMHLGEVVVAHDFSETSNESGRIVAVVDVLLSKMQN